MACIPGRGAADSEVFAFSGANGEATRLWDMSTAMWSAGWQTYWAFALETLNPDNYRR